MLLAIVATFAMLENSERKCFRAGAVMAEGFVEDAGVIGLVEEFVLKVALPELETLSP